MTAPTTPPPVRVMLVDDALVVRKIVGEALADDPAVRVVGTASNGVRALEKLEEFAPDLVVLDVEMPDMDGLQTLREIRRRRPTLRVIMFSTLTERGATTTLDALAAGANDYVHKPANVGSVSEARARIRDELLPKIKALCGRAPAAPKAAPVGRPAPAWFGPAPAGVKPAAGTGGPRRAPEIVVIGVSTGGPTALEVVLGRLPADLGVPVVIVQHMPPVFTRLLATRLDTKSPLSVREAAGGEVIGPGEVWLAPGDFHLTVRRDGLKTRLALNQGPQENSCRPAVDVLFRSAAEAFGPAVLAVVLTGMGSDGLNGARAVVAADGRVIAQDEASSVVWGMPGFVASQGLADAVLPLEGVAGEIARRCRALRPSASIRSLS